MQPVTDSLLRRRGYLPTECGRVSRSSGDTDWVGGGEGGRHNWAVGFFFGNTELSLELWTVIAGISGFDD